MARQVVPTTDKKCQEDFPEVFFKSDLRKSVKISRNAMFKQIGSNIDKIISKANKLFVLKHPMKWAMSSSFRRAAY